MQPISLKSVTAVLLPDNQWHAVADESLTRDERWFYFEEDKWGGTDGNQRVRVLCCGPWRSILAFHLARPA